jgi:hypothetical protein
MFGRYRVPVLGKDINFEKSKKDVENLQGVKIFRLTGNISMIILN